MYFKICIQEMFKRLLLFVIYCRFCSLLQSFQNQKFPINVFEPDGLSENTFEPREGGSVYNILTKCAA